MTRANARSPRSARLAAATGCALIAALACPLIPARATPAEDAPAVNTSFAPCAVCHSVDGSSGTGPTLLGIIGRKSGTLPGFRYSRAMKNAAITWNESSLDRYLADPQGIVPGNIMPFSGVADGAERTAIVAYLKTLR